MAFFMAHCYILFSKSLRKFYTGSTELDPNERLALHLSKHYGRNKFTSAANDWELVLSIKCNTIQQAKSIEKHIKRMKSTTYIENLIKYDEIQIKLLSKYE